MNFYFKCCPQIEILVEDEKGAGFINYIAVVVNLRLITLKVIFIKPYRQPDSNAYL